MRSTRTGGRAIFQGIAISRAIKALALLPMIFLVSCDRRDGRHSEGSNVERSFSNSDARVVFSPPERMWVTLREPNAIGLKARYGEQVQLIIENMYRDLPDCLIIAFGATVDGAIINTGRDNIIQIDKMAQIRKMSPSEESDTIGDLDNLAITEAGICFYHSSVKEERVPGNRIN